MAKPWGGAGDWAADAERAEAEEKEHQASSFANPKEAQSFPSLKEAIATKPKKKKAMTLSEFTSGVSVRPGAAYKRDFSMEPKGLTPDEMLRLPTGPKERSAEELEQGRLGGGFRSYGRSGPPPPGRNRGDDGGGRRSYGGFDDERRPPPREFDQPSRADEVDNWASMKKPLPLRESGRNGGGGGSKADEVDNWASGKKTLPARSTGFGSGYKDLQTDSDRWSREGSRDGDRERPRIVLDPPRGDGGVSEPAKTNRLNPFGAARPREEILAEKGLDWRKLESDIENRKPTSAHSSRPSSAQSNRSESPMTQVLEVAPKVRPKVNPFGDAKPREVLLQEQGKDWRKIDMELERRPVDRPETEEEKMLKEEIDRLKKEMEKEDAINTNGEALVESGEQQTSLRELVLRKERELELLILSLDDKIRFAQSGDRPGSGAGRVGFLERPPSQSHMAEESRRMEFSDRPQSRGRDAWTRPVDDRRAYQGSRERGILGSGGQVDRSKSTGERW